MAVAVSLPGARADTATRRVLHGVLVLIECLVDHVPLSHRERHGDGIIVHDVNDRCRDFPLTDASSIFVKAFPIAKIEIQPRGRSNGNDDRDAEGRSTDVMPHV